MGSAKAVTAKNTIKKKVVVKYSHRPVARTREAVGAKLTRTGRKVSSCTADIDIVFWGGKGDGPRTYNAPDCLAPASSDGAVDYFQQGITSGWEDVYDWYLPDQYTEVSGVPDGVYLLQTEADPDRLLVESDRSNNFGAVYIRLSQMAHAPSAQILGTAQLAPARHVERVAFAWGWQPAHLWRIYDASAFTVRPSLTRAGILER